VIRVLYKKKKSFKQQTEIPDKRIYYRGRKLFVYKSELMGRTDSRCFFVYGGFLILKKSEGYLGRDNALTFVY